MKSRAAYYRKYRMKKKLEAETSVLPHTSQHVAQQPVLSESVAQQILQHVAQHFSNKHNIPYEACIATTYEAIQGIESATVAQQSPQHVAQLQDEAKKGVSFPPSFPPSLPPQTPPNSSPLLSPQPSPKKGPAKKSAVAQQPVIPDEDQPDAPIVDVKNSKKTFATWRDYDEALRIITEETLSASLLDAFLTWIDYKRESKPADFYTPTGIVAEAKHFVRKHVEGFDVSSAVEIAVSRQWLGWDHKPKN